MGAGDVGIPTGPPRSLPEQDHHQLQQARDLFAGVLEAATEHGIIATTPEGLITVFNSGAERMSGYPAADMIGRSVLLLHDPAEITDRVAEGRMESGFDALTGRAAQGEPEFHEWTYITRTGRHVRVSVTATPMLDPAGMIAGYIFFATDVTRNREAEAALKESEERFRVTFDGAPGGMMLISLGGDRIGHFLQVNPALCRITGYSEDELLAMKVEDLTHPEHLARHRDRFDRLLHQGHGGGPVERHWVHADGHDLWVQFSVSVVHGEDDTYLVGQIEDVTGRRLAEERLIHLAFHDELTGLPNRTLFTDRLAHALAAAARSGKTLGVLFLDLDGFKAVNDAAGHNSGDQVLVAVARRLTDGLRPGDTVARLGGDEFAVVCTDVDAQMLQSIATRLQNALSPPHVLDTGACMVSASIGAAVSTLGTSAEELLRDADAAMYRAKNAGRGRVQLGSVEDRVHSIRMAHKLNVEAELRLGLDRHELALHGQPVVDLASGQVVAVETLIRWNHPERGLLGPGEFLAVAESSSLMLGIGKWVLEESCRMAAAWSMLFGAGSLPVHVNVSGGQLEAGSLSDDVLAALSHYELPGSSLVLELTETHMPLIANSVRHDLEALRERGVHLAIDDLGTGYSSLTRITELPIDVLKIDLSFVAGLGTDRACEAVVRAILGIGHAVGLEVVAEGVETPRQADLLREYGCETAQGYLYSRPKPETDLLGYLAAHTAGVS